MPVITRQQSRGCSDHSWSNRKGSFERPQTSLPTALDHHVRGETPEATQTKAEIIARCIHSSPLESLPAEIIELIAKVLRDQAMEAEGRSGDDFYKAASEMTADPPATCKCQDGRSPDRMISDEQTMTSYGSCEPSIPLSSTSKRLRQVVFNHRPLRPKVIKYCVHSLQTSAEMSDALRGNVRYLCLRATPRHIIPSGPNQLIHYVRLFPNLHELCLDWETTLWDQDTSLKASEDIHEFPDLARLSMSLGPDVTPLGWPSAMKDLGMMFDHLPLASVKYMDLQLHPWIDMEDLEPCMGEVERALKRMRYPRLETFAINVAINVELAKRCAWTVIETTLAESLQQDTITQISLSVDFTFTVLANAAPGEEIFLPKDDSHEKISPKVMPTEDCLQQLFRTLKGSCKNLRILDVVLTGESGYEDEDDNFDLLTFQLEEDSDDHCRFSTGALAQSTQSNGRHLGCVNHNRKVKYEVHQTEIDSLARIVNMQMDETAPELD